MARPGRLLSGLWSRRSARAICSGSCSGSQVRETGGDSLAERLALQLVEQVADPLGQDFALYERGLSFGNDEMRRLSRDVRPWRP